jgi:hypothetical protein
MIVMAGFSDRGQETPWISQSAEIAPWDACEVFSFTFGFLL